MKFRNLEISKIIFAIAFVGSMAACNSGKEAEVKSASVKVLDKKESILRGEYLVTVGGCNDCHTPKLFTERGMELDSSRLLSGHPEGSPLPKIDPKALQPGYWTMFNGHLTAALGPWGLTYARNLTPHKSGIKGWREDVFIKAFRTGKHMGMETGRPIMPPMPWFNLMKADEEDLKAIYHYLQSLEPVENYVPEPVSPEEVLQMAESS